MVRMHLTLPAFLQWLESGLMPEWPTVLPGQQFSARLVSLGLCCSGSVAHAPPGSRTRKIQARNMDTRSMLNYSDE